MQASARKITLDPSVDLSIYAAETEGYSGADLQALVYNAHLDAIHDTLSATSEDKVVKEEGKELAYTTFGGNGEGEEKVLSRAEQAAVTKRVSRLSLRSGMRADAGLDSSSLL
jgi:peroxin-1